MDTVIPWLTLGGHGGYVWGSVLMCALVAALEVAWLRQRRRAVLAALRADTGPTADAAQARAAGHPPRKPQLVQVQGREDT